MLTQVPIKQVIPTDVLARQHAVANEWEVFVGTGKLRRNNLRTVIANSWLRCRDIGINPLEERAQSVITTEEIEAKLHNENLGFSGRSVLDRMAPTVRDTGHVIVLADHSGRILYSVGHHQVQNNLEKINFRPGSEWHENTVGPNGVGTPLALGHAELIMGSEHYCQGWQPWVCYGAPVHNPSNQTVLGCVDITGPVTSVCVEAMALAISIAQTIEYNLALIQLEKREVLRNAYHNIQSRFPADASLVIDDHGYIVDINSHAQNLLNIYSPLLMQTSLNFIFPELYGHIKNNQEDLAEKEVELKLQNNLKEHVSCAIKPIINNRTQTGYIILFTSGKLINKNNRVSLRSSKDSLIQETLVQTGGNISKAAKILKINRSTIYRRKKHWQ